MKIFTLITLVFFITSCTQQPSTADKVVEKNALIIQADFGGLAMAGVAKSVSKDLDVYTLAQLIPLYDISAASNSLRYNSQTWPTGTVLVSVVDPGVGTERKSVVLKTKNGYYFVSPDNGSLSGPVKAYGIEAVREIDESINRREGTEWSHTFHGRDVYSYTGARLAAGVITFEEVGPLLEPKVMMLELPEARLEDGVLYGVVAGGVGRLGNVSFNINRQLFSQLNVSLGELVGVIIRNQQEVIWQGNLPYVRTFGEVPLGDPLLFVNSSGLMSVAINQGNFANTHNIQKGGDWTVEIRKL